VAGCNDAGSGPTWTAVREQGFGRHPDVDRVLARLVDDDGRLVVRRRRARGGGNAHWLAGHPGLPNE
jgi:hypothetical protein